MGLRTKVLSAMGIYRGGPGSVSALNGIRTASDLSYVEDAKTGHFVDVVWTREPLSPLPVILFFNGTSFISSKRARGSDLCRLMAKRDYLVVNAEFRDLSHGVSVRGILEDISALLQWLSDNAERFAIDTGRIYVTGSSYGALAALWTAMLLNGHRLSEVSDIPMPELRVSGLGLFTGMTDTESGDADMRTIAQSIRDLSRTDKTLAEAVCPWSNHDLRVLPPVFQVTSDGDSALPDVTKLDELLEINKVPHDTITFHGGSHTVRGFMETNSGNNECARALSRMFTFFRDQ